MGIELTPEEQAWRDETQKVRDSYHVWMWPEFQAFARRLGIPLQLDGLSLTIRIGLQEMPKVTYEFAGREPKDGPVRLTTAHNEKFETYSPPSEVG